MLELLGGAPRRRWRPARSPTTGRRGSARAPPGPSRWCARGGRRSPGGRCARRPTVFFSRRSGVDVVADGGEARPHLDPRRGHGRPARRVLHRADAPRGGLVGEEGVEDDLVEAPPAERRASWGRRPPCRGGGTRRDCVEVEDGPRSRPGPSWPRIISPRKRRRMMPTKSSIWAVVMWGMPMASNSRSMPRPRPSVKRPPVRLCMVRAYAARHRRVAGVVVGGRGGDGDVLADRADRAADRGDFLHVEPLGDEDGAEADGLALDDLVERAHASTAVRRPTCRSRVRRSVAPRGSRLAEAGAGAGATATTCRVWCTPSRIRSTAGGSRLIFMSNDERAGNSRISIPSAGLVCVATRRRVRGTRSRAVHHAAPQAGPRLDHVVQAIGAVAVARDT